MIELILWSLVLLMVQLVTPSVLALMGGQVSVAYLLSAGRISSDLRFGTPSPACCRQFARNTASILVLAVLSIINGTDVILLAQAWLVLRVIYLGLYLAGTAYVRSFVWVGALACLIGMALPLL